MSEQKTVKPGLMSSLAEQIEFKMMEQAIIIEQIHDSVISTDLEGVVTSWNKGAERLFGHPASEMLGHNIAEIYPPDQLSTLMNDVITPLKSKGSHAANVIMQRKNGERFHGQLSLSLRYDANRQPIGMIGYTIDITDQVRAEQALAQSEERMRLVLDAINDGIWEWNVLAHETVLSQRWKEILGYQEKDLSNLDSEFFDLVHPDDSELLAQAIARHFETRELFIMELRLRHKDGTYRWIVARGKTVHDANGHPVRMLGSIKDVTESKLLNAELRQFKNTLDQALDCVYMFDTDKLNFFYVNEGAMRQVGYSFAELLTMHPYDIKPEIPETKFREMIAPLLACEVSSSTFETIHQHKLGQRIPVEVFLQLIDRPGESARFVAIVRDITERKIAEEKLIRLNEELEDRIGQRTADYKAAREEAERASAAKTDFLSRMSHELRTPLNAILGFGQLLQLDQSHPLSKLQEDNVQEILKGGSHLLELINEVLDLSRIESGRLEINSEPVSVVMLFNSCVKQLQPLALKREIRIVTELDSSYTVQADMLRLREVMTNLLSNAIKYNHDSGEIWISCTPVAGDCLRVSVRDTGRGIAKESISRLFKPFERIETAYSGIEGSGIGLALSKKLVDAMHGKIGVESVLGLGSTFWFELPLTTISGAE